MPDLVVETVPVERLTPDPRNARRHGERNLDAIAESLRRFGQRRPLVVTSEYVVVAGNGTLEAAVSRLGWERVAVTVFPGTPEEARAYALADNRTAELAEWDAEVLAAEVADLDAAGWDMQALGFDEGKVATSVDEIVEDEVPPVPEAPLTVPGDLWLLGPHLVVCGSATSREDVDRVVEGRPVDLLFTDPPYGVAYVGGTGLTIQNDDLGVAELRALLVGAFGEARRVLRRGGPFYVCSPSGVLETTFRAALEEARLGLRQQLVWVKEPHVLGRADYHGRHETILYGWADGEVPSPLPDLEGLTALPEAEALYESGHGTVLYGWKDGAAHEWNGGRRQNTVWEFPKPSRSAEHPTMKPVALCGKAILNSAPRDGLVLDLFGGSGSTLVAAQQTGRAAALVELDPRYVDVICRRFQALTGVLPVRASTGTVHDFIGEVP